MYLYQGTIPSSRNVDVSISYYEGMDFIFKTATIRVTIPANTLSASDSIRIYDVQGVNAHNVVKEGFWPTVHTYFVTTGTIALSVNSSFFPLTDNLYDLGSSTKRWDDVYASNGTIQTSDLRQKRKKSTMIFQFMMHYLISLNQLHTNLKNSETKKNAYWFYSTRYS